GALDLESACRLVVLRANQMDTSTGQGRMLLVRASEDGVTELLEGLNCDIAAINGPASIVVSGVVHAIDEVIQRAALGGIAVRDLGVDYAFHSSLMEPHAEALASQLGWLQPCEATIPMISTVTGRPTEGPRLS